jgi:predicted DCC family thiol-disulfide oxidoreductase YuxK
MITVFYDGQCGLCRREIDYYKRIAPQGLFDWHDITLHSDALERLGISYVDALKQLHARDDQGTMHIGVDAFLLIWSVLPRWRWLARIVKMPLIYSTAHFLYRIFANWRFNRLNHCVIAQSSSQP